MCERCHQLAEQMNQLLENNIKLNRDLLDFQRARIPKYLSQARLYVASDTTINLAYHTQSQTLLRVTAIIIVVGSAATLTIAERSIPVTGTTILYLGPEGMLIRPEDTITLVQTVAGPMGLELLGEEMADRGKRW